MNSEPGPLVPRGIGGTMDRTVSFTFVPAPIFLTGLIHDYFDMLYSESLRGTTDHMRVVAAKAEANGRPIKTYSLSRDAKLLLAPQFAGPNRIPLPGPGSVLKCTTATTMVGRSYQRNESIFTYVRNVNDKPGKPSKFKEGDIIAGSVLGFVFVTQTETGGWQPTFCPEELVKGGWVTPSPLASIPSFSYLTRDELAADKYLSVPVSTRLPPSTWKAQFNQTDSFGHVTARKRCFPMFDYLYAQFPNAVKRDAVNTRGINVAANSVLGYYVEFKTETKADELTFIEACVAPSGIEGLLEVRFALQGEHTKGVVNRGSMLLVTDGPVGTGTDLAKAIPRTGRGRVMTNSAL